MRILITNDDGVQSPGIEALVKHLYKDHEVVVAAPACQQSYTSSAISAGVMGTLGLFSFLGHAPVVATVMMVFAMISLPCPYFLREKSFCMYSRALSPLPSGKP